MFVRKIVSAVALAAVTLTSTAQAGGSAWKREVYSKPGNNWQIDYVPEHNTCILHRNHNKGTTIQIVYLDSGFTILVSNPNWTNITDGNDYKLRMIMDGGADRWEGAAKGIWMVDGVPGLSMSRLSKKFMQSFMNRNYVDFYNGETGTHVTGMALNGTFAAVASLLECLDTHGSLKDGTPAPQQRQQKPEWTT